MKGVTKMTDNQVNANELNENEVLRLSVFDSEGSDEIKVHYQTKGFCKVMALKAISTVLEDEFDMICVPKTGFGGVIVCGGSKEEFEEFLASMTDDDDGNNGEGDEPILDKLFKKYNNEE